MQKWSFTGGRRKLADGSWLRAALGAVVAILALILSAPVGAQENSPPRKMTATASRGGAFTLSGECASRPGWLVRIKSLTTDAKNCSARIPPRPGFGNSHPAPAYFS